ncbi:MAG: hypothetical protein RL693_780 [Verrucomicrobiota bacterium]|jgi:hypothetical protein
MPTTASRIFGFLENHPSFSTERHEIALAAFSALRRSVRSIVVSLCDREHHEACKTSDRLRGSLSEWLSVPVPFDGSILAALQTIGDPADVEARWGCDIRNALDSALCAAQAIQFLQNPIRERLQAVIQELRTAGKTFKIYCHRTARHRFESLFDGDMSLEETAFLHSIRDYREADSFDTLIKVGPLRSKGWSSVPDAIKTAPKFHTLVQIVWSGCADEPGFGYDPIAPFEATERTPENSPVYDHDTLSNQISWTTLATQFKADDDVIVDNTIDEDEFLIFRNLNQAREKSCATLVQIDSGKGILYPRHSQVLSFDPDPQATDPFGYRLLGETLIEGVFVILTLYSDVDLGGSPLREGTYNQTWKTRLAEKYRADPNGLVTRLHLSGIDLIDLHACIERWSGSQVGVLPAPGHAKHFQILINELDLDWNGNIHPRKHDISWWKCAWDEIRHARGEAIQTGRNEHDLIDEELLCVLNKLLPEIRNLSQTNKEFQLSIPDGKSLHGVFRFFMISAIEEAFLVPDSALKLISELTTIEQWRV